MSDDHRIIQQVAAKAVIVNDSGEVLILREASADTHPTNTKSGRYQLPGGRINVGEKFENGLRREILEETGLQIEIGEPLLVGEWRPVIKGVTHQIVGIFVAAKSETGKVRISGEHDNYQWIDPVKRASYDIVAPDWRAIDAHTTRHN